MRIKTKTINIGENEVHLYRERPFAAHAAESAGYDPRLACWMYKDYNHGWLVWDGPDHNVRDVYGDVDREVFDYITLHLRKKTVFNDTVEGDKSVFSNFVSSPMEIDGIMFPTSEHAYQAMKTLKRDERLMIAAKKTPGEAKRAGRSVTLRSDWENVKIYVMTAIVFLKFAKNKHYAQALLETGDDEIIEDARRWDDCEWGIGREGKGRNLLGICLMVVRNILAGTPHRLNWPPESWFSIFGKTS